MDIFNEFDKIVLEHERVQDETILPDTAACRRYLEDLLPIELYLKNIYCAGDAVAFWERYDLFNEKYRFRHDADIVNIQIVRNFRYDCHRIHEHSYFQLSYVYKGNAVIHINDTDYTVTQGDFIVLAPKTRHQIRCFTDDGIVLKFYIRRSTFENVFFRWLGERNSLSEFYRRVLYGSSSGKFLIFQTGGDADVCHSILEMYREYFNNREYSNIIVECQLTEFFCRLVRDYAGSSTLDSRESLTRNVGFVIKYIIEHHSTVTLDELAAASGYTKTYLCRLLLHSTGKTFTQLLNAAKIDAAANMLRTTELSISEIAVRSGFNTSEHFHRVFKQYRDTTPQKYRDQNKVNEDNV